MKSTYWIESVNPSTGQVSSRVASVRHLSLICVMLQIVVLYTCIDRCTLLSMIHVPWSAF